MLPRTQRQKRVCVPGQPKYTSARVDKAVAALEAGEEHRPIKRSRAAVEASTSATAATSAQTPSGDEDEDMDDRDSPDDDSD